VNLDFIFVALATHRLTALWISDKLFEPIRSKVANVGGLIGYLANCPLCISVWAGLIAVLAWLYLGTPGRIGVWSLAASMFVMFSDKAYSALGALKDYLQRGH
jgi:hypothetical protein